MAKPRHAPADHTDRDGVEDAGRAYEAPLLEVAGEARFSGKRPVQFDRPPLVFNPLSEQYEPFSYGDAKLTPIKRENPFDYWFGVVGAMGTPDYNGVPRYYVSIYPVPNTNLEDTVLVTMWGLETANVLDAGMQIWPIVQSPVDGAFYHTPNCNERLAVATSLITARSTTTAGTGTAQFFSMDVVGTVGTYVAASTGSVQVYSISGVPTSGTGTIASGTYMIIRKIFGYWHVVAADCSGAP